MLWLQTPPWGKWIAALLIVSIALWVELRPDPMTDHPFATSAINVGDVIDESNTEIRRVPAELFEAVPMGRTAARAVSRESPVLADDVRESRSVIPTGWWIVATDVPVAATPGDEVRLVLLDGGTMIEGVVTAVATDDPFGTGLGAVAVPPEAAAEVASAQANGRVAVLVSTG